MKKFCQLIFLFICLSTINLEFSAAQTLVPHKIKLQNGKVFDLNLPANYEILPAAENLKRVRFFAKAPDGRIFVTDMHDLSDNKLGAVYILDEFDLQSGKFRKVLPYLRNLRNPNSVQFYTDETGQNWLYIATTDKLLRYKFTLGETAPTDKEPQTLATFPDYGLSYKYGGWHLTRTIAVGLNNKIYVSVGSSCNACKEKEAVRASILEMDPDGRNQRFFARGLRNAVGLKFVGKFLFATNQGADHLGLNKPDETFYAVKDNANYGWPGCYQASGRVFADAQYVKGTAGCSKVPVSYAYLPAHGSALGFDYFDENTVDPFLRNAFLIALHGSTNKRIGHGYKLVLMRKNEKLQDFMTGFLQKNVVYGRPCDVMRLDENSFLMSDDKAGVIYYVRRKQ